ncbi:unnamed protein product [Timema podura]|uniref:Uncharacterized protein n=1 Tax=Timema podura TaxID=61482 RepID=A0ABN7NZF2_TIMPD|nr:unnamed protein product [Timema podura]
MNAFLALATLELQSKSYSTLFYSGKNDSTDEESAADEQETWSSSTCRLCLKEGENTRHIFDAAKPLPSLIMECVSVEVTMDDGLPLLICQDCQHHLDSWYKFKQQCQTTDKILHGAAVTSDDEMSDNTNEETQEIKPELEVTDSGSDELSKNDLQSAQDSSLTKINTKKSDNSLIVETLEMVPDQTVVDQNIPESNSEDAGAHKCTLCNKQFSTSVDCELHVELFHHQSESFSCGKCPKLFSTANMLLNHQCCHLPEGKGFSCPQCHKGFFSWPGLRNHFNIHMEKFKCSVCDKCETSSVSLKVHMRKHTKEQPFLCPMCPRTFAYESSLRYHIRAHTGDKQFMCDQCGYASLTSSNLWAHKARAHTTEKNHICEVCGKAFNTKDRLKLHREIHSNRRDHICDQCGMAFRTKKKVREHKFVHTGLRPYVCLVCRKAFARKDALKEHGFIHSGEKRFHCEKCGKGFLWPKGLRNHKCIPQNTSSVQKN